jgi:hypothetical protein
VMALFTVAARDINRFFLSRGSCCNPWESRGNDTICLACTASISLKRFRQRCRAQGDIVCCRSWTDATC